MLIKFETKGCKVLGLSFHPNRPWILAGLYDGKIQIWDYNLGRLVHTFEGHVGAVRGVHFHPFNELFVSGGNDMDVKVWNYRTQQCSFALKGHRNWIYTVQFHHESPWIVSASGDSTIRIWDFQARTCLSVLRDHTNSVMCASFHAKDDLMVSASRDKTVRVWDISPLREKTGSSQLQEPEPTTKFLLKGHTEAVNWVCFHPTSPIIVSASDDWLVKLWRMSDSRCSDFDTMEGHRDNVSSATFLDTKLHLIVSSSDDKTIRFYDMMDRKMIETYGRRHDRFWVLTKDPSSNLLAAGHDSGLMIFKKERERPCFYHCLVTKTLYALRDGLLYIYNLEEGQGVRRATLSRPSLIPDEKEYPINLCYSPSDAAILISYNTEESGFEIYYLKDILAGSSIGATMDYNTECSRVEGKEGTGTSVVSVALNQVAVLDKNSNQVVVKNLQNKDVAKGTLPIVSDSIFHAGPGKVLCKSDDGVAIYDLRQMATICKMDARSVKYVSWSDDMESVALISKRTLYIAGKDLVPRCVIHENVNLKSGAWDENGAFVYNTLSHIKYCFTDGENGIIQTLGLPGYITGVDEDKIFFLDRKMQFHIMTIDNSDYMLKLYLQKKKYKEVVEIIKNSNIPGQAMASYLTGKGFPELALLIVTDEKTRFNLALECGNMEKAIASAEQINEKGCWNQLGGQALKQGHVSTAEYAYQQAKNFTILSTLYLVTGNMEKLTVLGENAETDNNFTAQIHNAFHLGNVMERIKILESSDQLMLAYITARTHGLTEMTNRLEAKLGANVPVITRPRNSSGSLLVLPLPIIRGGSWPLLKVGGAFDNEFDELVWELEDKHGKEKEITLDEPGGSEMHGDVTDRDSDTDMNPGQSVIHKWTDMTIAPADHVAAGNVAVAVRMLHRQIAVSNFGSIKEFFINTYVGNQVYLRTNASAPALEIPLASIGSNSRPMLVYTLSRLNKNLESACQSVTSGRYVLALEQFLTILRTVPFVVADSTQQVIELKALVRTARDYALGLKMELKRNELTDDIMGQQHLAVCITYCKLQEEHYKIVLYNAMVACYYNRNFMTASYFARLLIENGATGQHYIYAQKVIQFQADGEKGDEVPPEYDHRNSDLVCGSSFLPIHKDQDYVVCPLCSAQFYLGFSGTICGVCEIATVGGPATGHICFRASAIPPQLP